MHIQYTLCKASVLVSFLVTLWDWTYDFGAVGTSLYQSAMQSRNSRPFKPKLNCWMVLIKQLLLKRGPALQLKANPQRCLAKWEQCNCKMSSYQCIQIIVLCSQCTPALHTLLVQWVAHCTKVVGSIPEGDKKPHKDTMYCPGKAMKISHLNQTK